MIVWHCHKQLTRTYLCNSSRDQNLFVCLWRTATYFSNTKIWGEITWSVTRKLPISLTL